MSRYLNLIYNVKLSFTEIMELTNYTYPLFIEPCLHIAAGVGSVPSAAAAAAATAATSVTTAASVA